MAAGPRVPSRPGDSRLSLVLRYEGNNVAALLASERCQFRMRTNPRLPAMQLHNSAARLATRRHQMNVQKELHLVAFEELAAVSCSMPVHTGRREHGLYVLAGIEHACLHGALGYSSDLGDLFYRFLVIVDEI